MFTFLKNLFTKRLKNEEEEEVKEEYKQVYSIKDMIEMTNFNAYPDPEIINPEGDITVMYMDDSIDAMEVNDMDLQKIKERYIIQDPKLREHFKRLKIVKCYGKYSGQIAIKYLRQHKVDKALLDLTLAQSVIYFPNGQYLDLNGTDVAIELFNHNSNIDIALCTSHIMSKSNEKYMNYVTNFERHTGANLYNHYINRLEDRLPRVIDFLFTNKYRIGVK